MNTITFDNVVPHVFRGQSLKSEVWGHRLTFARGEKYLIEAASGTGKSSLCSFLYGYRHDYDGSIVFDDTDVRSMGRDAWREVRQHSVSLLFQELRLFTELTALENIELKNNLTHYKTREEIVSLLERVGLADKVNAVTGRMSFGQQQRVAFVRALCQPFDFILLDEPVSHLDESNSDIMGTILDEELTRRGAGMIATSIGKHIRMDYNKTYYL